MFCNLILMKTYSERLRYAMQLRGRSYAEVANAPGVGVKYQAIQHLCRAEKVKGSKHTAAIAAYLEIDPRWLAEGIGEIPVLGVKQKAPEYSIFADQLMTLYNTLDRQRQDDLVRYANMLHAEQYPNASIANPFPRATLPPKLPAKRRR